jgi:hypothetical protein
MTAMTKTGTKMIRELVLKRKLAASMELNEKERECDRSMRGVKRANHGRRDESY